MGGEASELFEAGRFDDALAAYERSAEAARRLVVDDPAQELVLAGELNNVGLCLGKLRRFDRSVVVLEEAVDIFERHWRDDASLAPFYAGCLASLAGALADMGRYDAAIERTRPLVSLRRAATEPGPVAVDPDLAKALRLFAWVRALRGRELDQALSAASEAVVIYGQLAGVAPEAFVGELHLACRIYADVLDGLGQPVEAAEVRARLDAAGAAPRPTRPS